MAEQLDKTLIQNQNSFNAPSPGESLTASPSTPNAWERPPQNTDEDRAMEELYLLLTEKERISQGISPQMVRFSAGIESVEDLKKDLLQSSIKQI